MYAPLLTLSLCLGGILFTLPRSTAKESFSFPDGSTCYTCEAGIDFEVDSDALHQCVYRQLVDSGSNLYCTAPGGACEGTYYPPGFENSDADPRYILSYNQCTYASVEYHPDAGSSTIDWHGDLYNRTVQDCCFKPGSPVCISNFLVHHSELMLGPELM